MSSGFFKKLGLLIIGMLIVSLSHVASARFSENPKMGINVGGLGKLTSSIPFTDIFKISRGWLTSCEFDWGSGQPIDPDCTRKRASNTREQNLLQLDGNGWVRSLPSPQDSPVFTSVTSTWRLTKHFPTGRYVVLYDGTGVIKMTGDLRMGFQRPGHIEFDLLSPKRNLKLQITRTDPHNNGDYIRNIRIVPKKHEKDYQRYVFNPDYLARISPMHAIRFMPWTNPRGNEAVDWNQRAGIGRAHYTGNLGVPAERMVDMANAINAAPWLSVPYKASDDYIREYARMVKKRLRKTQTVYIEYSNEVWNTIFPATTYAARKADKLWKFPYKKVAAGKRRVLLAANWYAKRSVEMCNIWKQEFGQQRNRVKCVVGSLTTVPWVGKEILDCPLWKEAKGCGRFIDAYGIGPYFGDYIARKENRDRVKSWTREADGGMGRLFQEILSGGAIKNGPAGGSMERLKEHLISNKKLADKYNLEMLAYEAGQHLIRYDPPHTVKDPAVLNLFMNAQKDPRMKEAYEKYLATWAQYAGGLLLHFYGIGEPEPKNFFGMLDHLHQPSTPKYLAMMDYLGGRSTYVPPVRRQAPVQIPVAQAQAPAQVPMSVAQPQPQYNTATAPMVAAPRQQGAPVYVSGPISGNGVNNWTLAGNTAISPEMSLGPGHAYKLFVLWHFEYQQLSSNDYFRIYAVDHNGGRKLLYSMSANDIAKTGKFDQVYEEDISRYIGPPIRFMFETSGGLKSVINQVTYW